MSLARRDVLRLAGGAAIALPLASCRRLGAAEAVSGSTGAVLRSTAALPRPFTVPLPVPPVLRPTRSDATMDYYEVTARPGQAEILPGYATEIWGYNGIFPGPTLETRSGRMVVVRHEDGSFRYPRSTQACAASRASPASSCRASWATSSSSTVPRGRFWR